MVAAAGNEGGEGPFYISAPGSGKSTVSVASIDNTYILTPAFQVKDGTNYRKSFFIIVFYSHFLI